MDDNNIMDEEMAIQTAAWTAAQKQPLCFYRRGQFPSPASIHTTITPSDNYDASNVPPELQMPVDFHNGTFMERQKGPLAEEHLSRPSLPHDVGKSTLPNVNAPSNSTAIPTSHSNYMMPWQGDYWSVQPALPSASPAPITNPIPVRFQATLLTPKVQSDSPLETPEWILGLVIHSYVKSDQCELMYVILLDDGNEVHLPCGEVDRISMAKPCNSTDFLLPLTQQAQFQSPGGHPSSQEREGESQTSFNSFYSTLLRSSEGGNTYADDDFDMTSPRVCNVGVSSTALENATVVEPLLLPTSSMPPTRSYARLFKEVVVDAVTLAHADVSHENFIDLTNGGQTDSPILRNSLPPFPGRSHSDVPAVLMEQLHNVQLLSARSDVRVNAVTDGSHDVSFCAGPAGTRELIFSHVPVPAAVPVGSCSKQVRRAQSRGRTGSGSSTAGSEQGLPTPLNTGTPVAEAREPQLSRPGRNGRLSAAALRKAFLETFADDRWTMERSAFVNPPSPFAGPTGGPSFRMVRMPTKASLFGRFWTDHTLDRICVDTNRYASEMHPRRNVPLGGAHWWPLHKVELKAFMAVNMLMGIKRLPNHRNYWNRSNEFLYCPSISTIMTRRRYEDITRCLHVADDSLPAIVGTDVEFDRLRKMRWLICELQQKFKLNWHLHQEVTVDETMIPYKGRYCPVRQYLPRKPTKWGVKVWCLVDARLKYLYDFQIYTGSIVRESLTGGTSRDAKTGEEVVMQLMEGLHGRAHMVCTDNYFTSVQLLLKLRSHGTYGCGTVRCNRMGLPTSLLDLKSMSKEPQGSLLWRLHAGSDIAAVVFVDRKAVFMLSSFYPPVPSVGELWPTVPRRINGIVTNLETSPVHKGYCDFMRGVDVADHLRGSYSTQTHSHKWWHKFFFYLLDTSMVNCYILNKVALEQFGKDPVSHFHFQLQLADELSRPWSMQRGVVSQFRLSVPGVHGLVRSARRTKCRFCRGAVQTNLLCPQCGGVFLHSGECYQRSHYALRR